MAARSTDDARQLDPTAVVVFHQADIGGACDIERHVVGCPEVVCAVAVLKHWVQCACAVRPLFDRCCSFACAVSVHFDIRTEYLRSEQDLI